MKLTGNYRDKENFSTPSYLIRVVKRTLMSFFYKKQGDKWEVFQDYDLKF